MGCWVARVIIQKDFKRQSFSGKVLPHFRDKPSVEPIQKKGSHCPGLLVVPRRNWQPVFIFSLRGSGFIDKDTWIINLTPFAQNSTVSLSLPSLNPDAHFSSLLINILCGILFFFFLGGGGGDLHLKPVQADLLSPQ